MTDTCAYCELPGHMRDPFSGAPCCRVDFELITGALDFDGPRPSFDQLFAESERIPFTPEERAAWYRLLDKRFGGSQADQTGDTT